jgi:sulfate/thiosulfate transport system substrate-binding protein
LCIFCAVTARRQTPLALVVLALAGVLAACGGADGGAGGGSSKLSLVAYSTPKEAYEEIIPAFAKTPAGAGTRFTPSYGNSGDQARAIIAGLPTDVAALSLEPDITKLVEERLVAPGWKSTPTKGIVTRSVVALCVRPGNPKRITGWADLVKTGIEVLTPNPFTSGGARWNVMAAYGAQLEQGKTYEQAVDYLLRLFRNVPVQDKSAREAIQTFIGGKGDVMIAYENEAINAQQKHQPIDYVVPDQTILIENPIAVVSKSRNPEKAKAFVDFLHSPAAQRVFADKGYRPVDAQAAAGARFPAPPGLFTIADLGGWSEVTKRFFDKESGIIADIEQQVGVSVGS